MKNRIIGMFITAMIIMFSSAATFANKTSVTIDAPKTAKKGSEISITLNVNHMGNTSFHFTDWVVLKINSIEVKKWSYTSSSLPPSENFTLTFKFIVTEDLIIQAEGNCNMHGSAGWATANVKVVN
jgi:desulfoferrodoxin (superoxide reductase-like protein)